MHRRLFVFTLAACSAAARVAAQPERPHQKIGAARLLEGLAARFPLRFGAPGLVELEVRDPALLLLAARNKLGAALRLEAGGPALRDRVSGEVDVLFALRYEASDRTIRAREPEIHGVRWPGLPPETAAVLSNLTRGMLAGLQAEVVLHRFTDRELALPDAMGLEPGTLTVVEDGLDIAFVPQARR
jgi:hypothetical protein